MKLKQLTIHAKINVRMLREINGVIQSKVIETTVGKIIFNESIPQDLGFVNRENEEEEFNLEIDFLATKKT